MTKLKKYTTPSITHKKMNRVDLLEWIWNGITESTLKTEQDTLTPGYYLIGEYV
jgi:hypothetical protein